MQRIATRLIGVSRVAILLLAAAATEPPSMAADAPVRGGLPRRVRRLPPHYANVATPQQREKIYQIQDEYRPRIEALEKQLADLRKELKKKCEAVLSPEQTKQISDAEAKQKAARESKAKERAARNAEQTPKAPGAKAETPKAAAIKPQK